MRDLGTNALPPRVRLSTVGVALLTLLMAGCSVDFGRAGDPACGNGVVDPDEECDATDLGGATCETLGYRDGTLTCDADCTLGLRNCEESGFCGNLNLEPAHEECDASALGGATCEILGLGTGQLTCTTDCLLDTTGCVGVCGDGVLQPDVGEVCDGPDLGSVTCESLGFVDGEVACTADCTDFALGGCTPQATGGPCQDDVQCTGGLCWSEADTGWPDGICLRDCATEGCEPPAECIEHANGDRRCYQPCTDYLDCRPGYACFDRWVSGTSYCHALCADDSDCPDTGNCNQYSRLCGTPEVGAAYGAPCTVGTDCLGGACLLWTDGYCSSMCSLTNGQCPAGTNTVCVDMGLGGWGDLGLCVPSCTDNADCPRAGYSCNDTYLGPQDICAPN